MTNDSLYAQIKTALNEIDASPPNRLPAKTLSARLQHWETTLAIAEYEIMQRLEQNGGNWQIEPLATMTAEAVNLQTQIGLGYESLPEVERRRLLDSMDTRHTNAVRMHTMRERHANGSAAQPVLAGLTLPKAS